MTRNMYIAAVFAFATALAQVNQCANGGAGCTGDSVPQNIVSMLQTNVKTNVLKDGGEEDNSNKQIAELMAQEKDAIASEDFVAAQNLKSEINALQSKAASSGVLDAGADVDGKKESLVGNMLMLNKPAAILTELEQKVTAGEVPAFDVISQIKTLVTDDIMPYLQDSRDQAIQQATELRALVTACNEDFKSSDAYPGSTMEQAVNTARSNHITCRDAQDTAHAFNLTQPDSYCVKLGELLHDTMPLSSPGASASPRATSVASVVSALHTMPSCNSDVLQLDANCTQQETELANKHQECSLKQETFEFRFCEWKDGLESKCKTLDSCYSTTSGLYNAHVAQMKTSLEKWDIENKTLHTILCYCNVWLRSTDSADNRSQHNASHFEACKVSTHPTEVVELVPTQKDDCMLGSVSNHPGTQAFTDQEYGSVTDFVAPVIPCIPDCGVNEKIVENVCVACPAGKTSPGRNSTICDATLCGTDEKVVGHICVKCAPGKMSMSNNDASGADTQCQATKCGANEKVVDHVCVQCPAGKIGSGDDDASGGNTQCEATTTTTTTTEATTAATYQYFKWTIVQSGTTNHICVDCMKMSAHGKDFFPVSVQRNGFSSHYDAPTLSKNWAAGRYEHWCGWSQDGDGANLVLDMGETLPFESYSFVVHTGVCVNDPRKWTMQGSNDGQSWHSLGGLVEHDCNQLNHADQFNTFDFTAQATTAAPTAAVPTTTQATTFESNFKAQQIRMAGGTYKAEMVGIKADGTLFHIGMGSEVGGHTALPLPAGSFVSVSANWGCYVALRADGTKKMWGAECYMGSDFSEFESSPKAKALALTINRAYNHCFITLDYTLKCYGYLTGPNALNQDARWVAIQKQQPTKVLAVSTDEPKGFCAILYPNKTAYCWSSEWPFNRDATDQHREVGLADGVGGTTHGVALKDTIYIINRHMACSIKESDSTVLCWGYEAGGKDGTQPGSTTPLGSDPVRLLRCGNSFCCAIKQADSKLVCVTMGTQDTSKCNGGCTTEAPTDIAFDDIFIGWKFACGLKSSDQTLFCWGDDDQKRWDGRRHYSTMSVITQSPALPAGGLLQLQ